MVNGGVEDAADRLTFSMWMTKMRFWCIVSNGDRIVNHAIDSPEIMHSTITVRARMRRLYRCTNGTASGAMYAPLIATMFAMMNSAGASSPMRPVFVRT